MKRRFIQRELSWVAFNARVLHEGLREDTALLDRIKFMAITSSNFDEFFKVRIARLMRDIEDGDHPYPPDDDRPSAILRDLLSEIRQIICKMERALTEDIFQNSPKRELLYSRHISGASGCPFKPIESSNKNSFP